MYVIQSSISRNFILPSKCFVRDFINLLVNITHHPPLNLRFFHKGQESREVLKKTSFFRGNKERGVDWLPERARWSDTARPGLPVSSPQIKFRQSSSECMKVFFLPKLLSAKVKRFFVISLSLWNQKKRQRE